MIRRLLLITALTSLLLIIQLSIYAQESDVEYPKFAGIWSTERGQLALWQANDAVWGVYGERAELGGHIDEDGYFRFRYDELPNDSGTGWFKLSADGTAMEGMFNSTAGQVLTGSWNGTYLGENRFEVDDRAALVWRPGEESEATDEVVETSNIEEGTATAAIPVSTSEGGTSTDSGEFVIDTTSLWNGTWDTSRGTMILEANSTTIHGSFAETGVIEGVVVGDNEASCKWSLTDENGVESSGEALFNIDAEGLSFRGTYNSSSEPNLWLPWLGTKQAR